MGWQKTRSIEETGSLEENKEYGQKAEIWLNERNMAEKQKRCRKRV
jgi:hypothetical protein